MVAAGGRGGDPPARLSPAPRTGDPGFAPARGDYVRRLRLGVISAEDAAREYLTALTGEPAQADITALAGEFAAAAVAKPPSGPPSAPIVADGETAGEAGLARFRPRGQDDLAPSGAVARVRANLAALHALRTVQAEHRPATAPEQAVLARWSGWGAVPEVFDDARADLAWARDELRQLLSEAEYAAAARNTLNAHYTDADLVQAIWAGVTRLGFTGGRVLEPGCGSGNFLAFAPDGTHLVGVELEPTTAAIAAALYPQAQVLAESFAETRAPEASFDLAIGNVPFGRVALTDRRHNPAGHSIHNHFIVKALHLTRPGGLVAVLTSRYTMDAANPAARREMAALADLVGAVRLPSRAHARAAGTDVVTDLLVLRRREPGRAPADVEWERTQLVELDGEQVRVNGYFLAHPRYVLGELGRKTGGQRTDELIVQGDRQAGPALTEALAAIGVAAHAAGLTVSEADQAAPSRPAALVGRATNHPDGYLTAGADAGFTRVESGQEQPYTPPASQAGELRALLGLRDNVVALLEAEATSIDDTADIEALRTQLNTGYDAYVAARGPINRFSWRRTGRVDPDSGEDRLARIRPPQGGFRSDPYATVVYALEHFDAAQQSATKADIFRQRVVAPRAPRLGADDPVDALAICLDAHGEVRLGEVARLLGVDDTDARTALGSLVFDEPGTDRLVPAAEYLSGNVRTKLAAATLVAVDDPRYAVNVTALTAVIPRDLTPDEIDARLGAAWIHARHIEAFLRDTLDDPTLRVEHPGGALWTVKSDRRRSVLATTRWGTPRYPAPDVAQALLEQRQIRISDEDDGKRVFNPTETLAAQEKAAELAERFAEWVWDDPQRATELARVYNDTFNAIVLRSYDDAQLSLPGLALTFKPMAHQVAAVARIINEPAVGLFHEVGAGKTAEMVMGAIELRRLGLVAKPAIVVPNHMLEQFSREFLQLYPQAKLLAAASEDLDADRRRLFVARCATGDWDAVIMTRTAFERLPMSRAVQAGYLRDEVAALKAQVQRANAEGQRYSIKRLERVLLQAQERLKTKLDGVKDPGITFEQTGIDYLFVDEAHAYKNLRTASNVPGMAVDGSARATDLHMKLAYLRGRSERVGTLATATPIANSMGEAFTMQRYLRPDLLAAAGVAEFDVWAATFGQTVTAIEVAPDGGGMRLNTRFAKFRNVPELLRQWHVSADVKTAEDLQLPTPLLAARPDGQRVPETVVVAPSEALTDYMAGLAERADRVRSRGVDPTVDNLLKISSDGRAAALDLRLVGGHTAEPQKIDLAAERIAAIWAAHRDSVYPGPDGQQHATRGALQIVFADLGTPKSGRWSVYDALRDQLVAHGLPRTAVRFVHEARNDQEKGELFAACRVGQVAVLIGSTEKMGVGTNVQARAVALHHLDCPWRPADVQQREGRILRQGNLNPEVQILRYVTEASFDAYLWQTVQRKASFIGQVMRGRLDVREIDDVGEAALSYNEVKALATGNPLLLDHAQAHADVTRLERLERAHQRSQDSLRWTIHNTDKRITVLRQRVADTDAAITRRVDTTGDQFTMTVTGQRFDKRTDAGSALRTVLTGLLAAARTPSGTTTEVGTLGGFPLTSTMDRDHRGAVTLTLTLTGVPASEMTLDAKDVATVALVTRLENRLHNLETQRGHDQLDIERLTAEVANAQAQAGQPFRHADQLDAARARLGQLDELIASTTRPAQPSPPAPPHAASTRHSSTVDSDELGDAQWAAAPARHDASATPAPLGGTVVVVDRPPPQPGGPTATHMGAVHVDSGPDGVGPGPSHEPRAQVGEAIQRFYDARWYGTTAQQRHTAEELRAVLAGVADQCMAGVEAIEVGDYTRAQGIDPVDGRPAAVSGVLVTSRPSFDPSPAPGDEPTPSGYLLTVQPPQPGGGGVAFDVFVAAGTSLLRLPAPKDHGRPAWPGRPDADAASAPARPVAPPESPVAAGHACAEATPVGPGDREPLRVQVDGASVLVYGTSKDDLTARAALKQAGFRWYPSLTAWGLARTLRPETRQQKIEQLVAAMRRTGRTVPVQTAATTAVAPDAHPAASPAQPLGHRAEPAGPVAPPGPAQSPTAISLDAWLAGEPDVVRVSLPPAAQQWLEQRIDAIAADPHVRAAAATGGTALQELVGRALRDAIGAREGWRLPEARSCAFFARYLDTPVVTDSLPRFASNAIQQALCDDGAAPRQPGADTAVGLARQGDGPPPPQGAAVLSTDPAPPGAVAGPVSVARLAGQDSAGTGGYATPVGRHPARPGSAPPANARWSTSR